LLALIAWAPGSQGQVVTRAEVLRAEDSRGEGPDGINPLIEGLGVPALRHIAIRGIGRLERPDLVGHLVPYLDDPALTATVAEALAQSLQGLPADSIRSPASRALLDSIFRLLRDRGSSDRSGSSRAALARSIGRLPYGTALQAREADSVLLLLPGNPDRSGPSPEAEEGVAHGLYALARARRVLGPLSAPAVQWLREVARLPASAGAEDRKRVAWLALTANGTVEAIDITRALTGERDTQLRRIVIAAIPTATDSAFRRTELARVAADSSAIVRLEWVRVYRQLVAAADCGPLLKALGDSVHHVRLAAIDALGGSCPESGEVVSALRRIIDDGPSTVVPRPSTGVSWHAKAHALAALARVDSDIAAPLLRRESRRPVWRVRMYVARGADAMRDTALLSSMAFDSVGNVREVAIQGLSTTLGHLADLVYVRALTSRDYHVILAAARALRGSPATDSIRAALIGALLRVSREQRQTSRDPRLELLARLRELGTPADARPLRRLLNDVDDEVATEAARVIAHLSGIPTRVGGLRRDPKLVTPPSGAIRVRVTMAASTGGGRFELLLDADEAPMTAARAIALIRRRYYDGLTFHRLVPNFVLQGGSPGLNEYVGDGPFMRDELGLRHHRRGALGISTRGRDTGDAQWFINIVDNFRLDHEYTVFATIVSGMEVVDRILEGDVIESVRVVP
jgi:cyclophilin family peptidyl-prolyl cis-trans isomerase